MNLPLPPSTDPHPKQPPIWQTIWDWLTRPHATIEGSAARRQARFAAVVALFLVIIIIAAVTGTLVNRGGQASPQLYPMSGLALAILAGYISIRGGRQRGGASLMVWSFASVGFFMIAAGSGDPVGALLTSLVPAFVLASILLPPWELVVLILAGIAAVAALPVPGMTAQMKGSLAGSLTSAGLLLTVGLVFRNALERQRLEELDEANHQLELARATLEQRVEERTIELKTATLKAARHATQLQTISEVAHTISLVSNIRDLLSKIAALISERFGFYHVGIFLVDEASEYAVLQAANSIGGQKMLGRSHRLRIDEKSIVSYAIRQREPRIALDVGADAVFFDNPDLPETRSEMAIPLMAGPRLIGALDVQSMEPAAFTEEDVEIMRTLADQVAIAIENARLFDETRRALEESRGIYNRFVRQEWEKIALERQSRGYLSTPAGVQELARPLEYPEIASAVRSGTPAVEAGERTGLAVPLKLRGETIGVLDIRTPDASRAWNPEEIGAIQRVADRAALALESVRLLAESERRAQREQVIGKVGNRMRQTLDLETVLRTAADELRQALGLESAEVRLGLAPDETTPRKKTRRSEP